MIAGLIRWEPGIAYAVGDLDELLPEPDLEARAPEGCSLASVTEVEAFLDAHTADEYYPRALMGAVNGIDGTVARQGGARHPALRLFLWQALSEAMVGAYPAREAVKLGYEQWCTHLRPGERRPRHELRDWLRWQVPRVQARADLDAVRERLDDVFGDPMAGLIDDAANARADDRSSIDGPAGRGRLPERFWSRPRHAAVRAAAELVGVSPEGLMLAVLIAVLAHVPRVVTLLGPRLGTVNALGCLVGPPGTRKGATFDHAFELVPPPVNARLHLLGTAQGFVKEFFRPTTKDERKNDPGLGNYVRHYDPVIVRTDEIATFAASTRRGSDNGERLLGELKRMVSGEALGSGYATDDKNLRCAPLSYRGVGLLAVAPAKAADLFSDLGGGTPERMLFAPVAPVRDRPVVDPGPFVPGVDTGQAPVGTHAALPSLGWTLPPVEGRQHFDDDRDVTDWLWRSARHRQAHPGDPLDAHRDYLLHMLAAGITVFDGRWRISGEDFELAGMMIDVSIATRSELLEEIAAEERRLGRRYAQRRREEALVTDAALEAQRAERLWVTERAVKIARQVIAEPGVTVRTLREKVDSSRRALWDIALERAKAEGWVVEREESGQGGTARCLHPGDEAPA